MTGKVRFHLDKWQKFTKDPWVLKAVSGYEIEFDSCPVQNYIPNEIPFSEGQSKIVDQEVKKLLSKGAIIPCNDEPDQFISTIFIVPKPNGKFRPIINLKYLNNFVTYEHFKQETFSVVKDLIQRNDYFTSVDLRDSYFSIHINRDFQKYLKFSWQGQLYAFVCAPFGLSSLPRLFTKLLKPVFAWFRQQGIRCSFYIDDSLNMNKDKTICKKNALIIADTLSSLGYDINREKSVFEPSQRIVYFGFILDSVLFKVFLPTEKVEKIICLAKFLLLGGKLIVRDLASFIGLIINAFHAILEAPLHYRELERNKISALGRSRNFNRVIQLSESSISEIQWWIDNVQKKNGKPIRPQKPTVLLQTDASLLGWGAYNKNTDTSIGGRWSRSETKNHINFLELLAIFYALKSFCSELEAICVSIQSDNTCAVAYINNMGGMASLEMDKLAKKIWQWCLERDIHLCASHISSCENVSADFSSRNFSDSTEWMLKKEIFQRLCKQCFVPDIDLFASRLNYQVEKFVSWFPEPGAFRYDAFSFSWAEFAPYIFPPFALVARCLNKIIEDRVSRVLIVIPHWVSQPWFPMLLSMLVSFPIRIPRHKDILVLPHNGQMHPLRRLSLVALVVSGIPSETEEFQTRLLIPSAHLGGRVQRNSTVWHGRSGVFGVLNGNIIPFVRLR